MVLIPRTRHEDGPATVANELLAIVIRVVDQYPAGRVRLRSEPIHVEVEPAKIERVVDNLVHNGLKHGGKQVTVRDMPQREHIDVPVRESLIVELYSK